MKRTWVWATMLALLLTAATAGAQDEGRREGRKGDKDRKGAKRHREGRGDRSEKSAFQPRREGKEGKRKGGRRDKPSRKARPQVLVLHLEHISTDSFLDTMEQLAETPEIGRILKQIPHAMNEESNTIVVIAPTELAAMIERIADGIDKPNEYRNNVRRREMASKGRMSGRGMSQCPRCKMRMGTGKSAGRYPMMGKAPGRKGKGRPQHGPRMRRKDGHGKRSEQGAKCSRCGKTMGECRSQGKCPMSRGKKKEGRRARPEDRKDRRGERRTDARRQRRPMVGMLMHPRMVRELGLSRDQVEKIEEVVDDLHQKMENLGKRIANARKSKNERELREISENARKRVMQLHKEAVEKVEKTLTPAQRKQWQQMREKMHRGRGQMGKGRMSEARDADERTPRHPRRQDRREGRRRDDDDDGDEEKDDHPRRGRRSHYDR